MGATHVTVRITNPADEDRFWEGLFLVDTGAAVKGEPPKNGAHVHAHATCLPAPGFGPARTDATARFLGSVRVL